MRSAFVIYTNSNFYLYKLMLIAFSSFECSLLIILAKLKILLKMSISPRLLILTTFCQLAIYLKIL